MNNTLFICDDDLNHKITNEFNYIFWNKSPEREDFYISVPDLVEENSDILKSKYLKFIDDLGNLKINEKTIVETLLIRKELSFWWMTLLTEKSNWAKTPQINNLIKFMAFEIWFRDKKFKKVIINTNNNELFQTFRIFFQQKKITIDLYSNKKSFEFKNFFSIVLKIFFNFKSFLWFLREISFAIPFVFLKNKLEKNNSTEKKITFISYLSEEEFKNSSNKINQNFWGPLPDYLNKKKIPSLWIFLPSRRFKLIKTLKFYKNLKNKNPYQVHKLLSSYLNLKVVKKVLRDYLLIYKKSNEIIKTIEKFCGYYWPLLKNDSLKSFHSSEAMSSIYSLALFEEVSKKAPLSNKAVFLYENQSWEKGFINSFQSKNIDVIGFAHSTIRYWDLRYFNFNSTEDSERLNSSPNPEPNIIAVHGKNDKNLLIKNGYTEKNIIEVESLRYMYLNKHLGSEPRKDNRLKKRLLVVGDFLKKDTEFMLSLMRSNESEEVLKTLDVYIRPHPACPLNESDIKDINASLDLSELGFTLKKADIVFTGNVSSIALEAHTLGKKIITARNFKDLDMSPLRGLDDICFVNDKKTFYKGLKECISSKTENQKYIFFNLDQSLKNWKRVLEI